jgi:WhiB family redox-sensing transcriptional regulator
MNRKPEEHGTVTGYNQHNSRGDKGSEVCFPCRQALSEYNRQRRSNEAVTGTRRVTYIAQREDWVADAACRGMNPSLFIPKQGDAVSARKAKAVCANCPVSDDCLEFAMRKHGNVDGGLSFIDGIYGSTNYLDRRRLRQERERALVESISAHPSRGRGAA